ncbi:MAG TPA: hypothetical protein VKW70_08580 [Terriglobia bacterium]|nr:hypothetical protein [Terriglobia bacterium]
MKSIGARIRVCVRPGQQDSTAGVQQVVENLLEQCKSDPASPSTLRSNEAMKECAKLPVAALGACLDTG